MKISNELVKERMDMSLDEKIELSVCRVEQWHNRWDGKIYVAFSGGKDSTVLLHLVRSVFPEVPAVFVQTGLEYPEINKFVNTIDNVIKLKPKKTFQQVIEKYGYPVINKENAQKIYEIRNTKSDKLKNKRLYGDENGNGKLPQKWHTLLDAPFSISHQCCNWLKKNPSKSYEHKSGNKPMLGSMIGESVLRWTTYKKHGCNMYESGRPMSTPIAFWTEDDVWAYIKRFNLPYSPIYDMGYNRTRCTFCAFGLHKECEPNKFQLMKETHPKMYDFCMNDLGMDEILTYMNLPH